MDSEYFYEKEAEYFGFTPFQFLDSVGEIVVKSVFSMFDTVGPEVLAKEATFLTPGQLEAGVGQWSALVESKCGRNYELFESYVIRNVFLLPDKFILPGHVDVLKAKGEAENQNSDVDFMDLANRYQAARTAQAYLDAEEMQLAEEERILNSLEAQLDQLKEKLTNHKLGSFEQMATGLAEKVASLQMIVEETIEQSKTLALMDVDSMIDESWSLGQRLQQSANMDSLGALEEQLSKCSQIASLGTLSVMIY